MIDSISDLKKRNAYYENIVESAPPKTSEEILAGFGITEDSKYHNYEYLYNSTLKAMDIYKNQPKT